MIYPSFSTWARLTPAAVAYRRGDVSVAYGDAFHATEVVAGWLLDAGVRAGDHVCAAHDDHLEALVLQMALDRIGACICAPAPRRPWARWHVSADRVPGDNWIDLPLGRLVEASLGRPVPRLGPPHAWQPTERALVRTSSGSTGTPKFISRSHATLVANLRSNAFMMGLGPGVTIASAAGWAGPALNAKTMAWVHGATLLLPRVSQPDWLQELHDNNVQWLVTSPGQLETTLPAMPALPRQPGLTVLLYGARVSTTLVQQISARITDRIVVTYGSTESGNCLFSFADPAQPAPHTCGLPVPGVTVQVADEDGAPVDAMAVGRVRVAVAVPGVDGYLTTDGSTRPFAPDPAWTYTGDLGYIAPGGMVHVLGREDNVVNLGGRKLNTAEIDEAVGATGLTREHAAFTLLDPVSGTEVWIALVPRPGAQSKELHAALRKRFSWAAPGSFRLLVLDRIPRLASTKPDVVRMREMLRRQKDKQAAAHATPVQKAG